MSTKKVNSSYMIRVSDDISEKIESLRNEVGLSKSAILKIFIKLGMQSYESSFKRETNA